MRQQRDVSEEAIKSVVLWDVTPCSSVRQLLVTANVVSSSPILVTLMMEELRTSDTPVLTRATQRNIPEDGILYSNRRENLRSYIILTD
jgi:hypothetical protein